VQAFKNMYWGYFTEEMCLAALETYLVNYDSIPKRRLTPKVCKYYLEEQLKLNPKFFKELDWKKSSTPLCKAMLELDSSSFEFIPKRYMDFEICHIGVTKNPCRFGRIPNGFKTISLSKLAVYHDGLQLKHVPVDVVTAELCHIAVTNNPHALQHVPPKLQTLELANLAITSGYVPIDGSIRPDLLPAVKELRMEYQISKIDCEPEAQPVHYKYVEPLDPRTLQEYMDMVSVNGYKLDNVPREHRTMELCLAAIRKHPLALKYVPAKHRTPELYLTAVARLPTLISSLPEYSRTLRVMKMAVDADPTVYVYTPKNLLGKIKKYLNETNPNFFMEE